MPSLRLASSTVCSPCSLPERERIGYQRPLSGRRRPLAVSAALRRHLLSAPQVAFVPVGLTSFDEFALVNLNYVFPTTFPSILCPHDPIRSHLCDPGNPYGGPWSKEEGGQGAVPRLLPATEHRAWAGAHAPGALLPRASWTTGAWAPSSRGLFGMSRQLAGPDIKVVGPPRPVSVRSGTRPDSPRPPQRARRASQASPLCGGNGMRGGDCSSRVLMTASHIYISN